MASIEVSAVVVNYRQPKLLLESVRSLLPALEAAGASNEILVVDNGSGDDSLRRLAEEFPDVPALALDANVGFATAVQLAVEKTSGEWLLLLNNDATIREDAVVHLLAAGRSGPRVGSVAALMRFARGRAAGTINSAGICVDRLGVGYDRLLGAPLTASEPEPVEVFGASGGAGLFRRAMLEDLGGFDTSFFMFLEDVDLAWRAQMRRWSALFVPAAVVDHHHSASSGHGSSLKYFHVGLNRVRTLAKCATTAQLLRYGIGMVLYDLAYVGYAGAIDRTLAPLRGRLHGLREWRHYRRLGRAGRAPIELASAPGVRATLRRRSAWNRGSAGRALVRAGVTLPGGSRR